MEIPLLYSRPMLTVAETQTFSTDNPRIWGEDELDVMTGEAFGLKLLQAVREMKAGQAARITVIEENEVSAARRKSGLTPDEFAAALHVSPRTLRDWELGRRHPQGTAHALIRIANRHPEIVREELAR